MAAISRTPNARAPTNAAMNITAVIFLFNRSTSKRAFQVPIQIRSSAYVLALCIAIIIPTEFLSRFSTVLNGNKLSLSGAPIPCYIEEKCVQSSKKYKATITKQLIINEIITFTLHQSFDKKVHAQTR